MTDSRMRIEPAGRSWYCAWCRGIGKHEPGCLNDPGPVEPERSMLELVDELNRIARARARVLDQLAAALEHAIATSPSAPTPSDRDA